MEPMQTEDHHTPTGECRHLWRVFGIVDRCVLCGADRDHPIGYPYGGGAA